MMQAVKATHHRVMRMENELKILRCPALQESGGGVTASNRLSLVSALPVPQGVAGTNVSGPRREGGNGAPDGSGFEAHLQQLRASHEEEVGLLRAEISELRSKLGTVQPDSAPREFSEAVP